MVAPTAARMMQATRAQMFRPGQIQRWGFVYRENRVPYYQRLFQKKDGKRQWEKTDRSPYLLYPYYTLLYGTFASAMYAMGRLVMGHKTWY